MELYNPYIFIPLLVWMTTQVIKFTVAASQGRTDFRYFYASGGMPSVHSAVVTSLAFTAFLIDGPQSATFGISAIFAAIVMYDSFGVRRATGEQATALNLILDSLTEDNIKLKQPQQHLREILGHKPVEVIVGAVVGLVLGGLFNYQHLGSVVSFATTPINQIVFGLIVAVSAGLIAAACVARFYVIRRYRHLRLIQQAIKVGFWLAMVLAAAGLSLAFLISQQIEAAEWVLWPGLLLAITLALFGALAYSYGPRVSLEKIQYQQQAEKEAWFEGPNKKRRAAKARAKKRK